MLRSTDVGLLVAIVALLITRSSRYLVDFHIEVNNTEISKVRFTDGIDNQEKQANVAYTNENAAPEIAD